MRHRLANASGDQHIAPAIAPATLRCLYGSCLHADIGPLESASLATRGLIICRAPRRRRRSPRGRGLTPRATGYSSSTRAASARSLSRAARTALGEPARATAKGVVVVGGGHMVTEVSLASDCRHFTVTAESFSEIKSFPRAKWRAVAVGCTSIQKQRSSALARPSGCCTRPSATENASAVQQELPLQRRARAALHCTDAVMMEDERGDARFVLAGLA